MRYLIIILLLAVVLAGQACSATTPAAPKLWEVKTSAQLVAAAAKIGSLGGTIRLAPGQYNITKPLVFKGNRINIVGTGWDTEIRMTGKGNAMVFEDCGHSSIRDLMITGTKSADSGIVFKGECGSNTVDFCRLAEFPISGIRFEGPKTGSQSTNTVSRCHFIGNLQDQLYLFNSNDFFILQNQFGTHGGNPKTGARLEQASAGTYSMNYHWGNEVALRLGPNSHFNRIENNRFENSLKEGVVMGGPQGWSCMMTIFTGNTVHTNSESASGKYPAVTATNVTSMTFTSNQVFSWASDSVKHSSSLIVGPGCKGWIIKDNIFGNNTGKGLIYELGQDHIVKDNIGE